MIDHKPIPFGKHCPKCEAKLQGGTKYCEKIEKCPTWRNFGGEHLHILCANCKFLRTTKCADSDESKTTSESDEKLPSIDQINGWLDAYINQANLENSDQIEFDFEPGSE